LNQEREATGPGIVVLSSSLQVLHMNRRARALLTQLNAQSSERAVWRRCTNIAGIIETMQERLAAHNWEQFHQYRMINDSTHPILLKGFGLPDRRGLPHSDLILLSPQTPAPMQKSTDEILLIRRWRFAGLSWFVRFIRFLC